MVERENSELLEQDLLRRSPALLRAAMNLSLHNARSGRKCWVANVATLLNNAGYDGTFSELSIVNQHIRNSIMCTYRDQFIQIWHASLEHEQSLTGQGGNKLRSYRLFKKDFVFEPYIFVRHHIHGTSSIHDST